MVDNDNRKRDKNRFTIRVISLPQCEFNLLYVTAISSHHDLEITRLGNILQVAVIELELVNINVEADIPALASLQRNALEPFTGRLIVAARSRIYICTTSSPS